MRGSSRAGGFVGVAMAIVACGSSSSSSGGGKGDGGAGPAALSDVAEQTKAGSRLTPKWLVTADGLKILDGFFDKQLGLRCDLGLAEDGKLRCLPRAIPIALGSYFEDAACSKPAYVTGALPSGCSAPAYVKLQTFASCQSVLRVAQPSAPMSTVYVAGNGGCTKTTIPAGSGLEAHAQGSPVAPSTFVGFSEKPDAVVNGVVPVFLEGDDGSRVFLQWRDAASGVACSWIADSTSAVRCAPADAVAIAFSDAACMSPEAIVGSGCPKPKTMLAATGACGANVKAFSVGAAATSTYYASAAGCTMGSAPSGTSGYQADAAIASDGFAKASYASLGTGRVVAKVVTPDGVKGAIAELADTTRGNEPCTPTPTADGRYRCAPVTGAGTATPAFTFEDSTCTKPLAIGAAGCASAKYAIGAVPGSCPPQALRFYSLGAASTPSAVFAVSASGACVSTTPIANASYYEITGEIPASTFAELVPQ